MTQKQRSLTLFGVILLLAGGIAAYAWLGVYQVDQKKDREKAASETLFTFKKEQVRKVALTAHGQTVEAQVNDGGWTIDAPLHTAGDAFALDAVGERLAGLKETRDLGLQSDLKQYGLDPPKLKAVVTLDTGESHTLALGNDNPYDNSVYGLRDNDGGVALLENGVKLALDKGLFELRDKRVVPFEEDDLRHLDVAGPKFAYGLDRSADGKWKVTAPEAMDADGPRCTQIVNALRNLKAVRFATDQASQADLRPGRARCPGLHRPAHPVAGRQGRPEDPRTRKPQRGRDRPHLRQGRGRLLHRRGLAERAERSGRDPGRPARQDHRHLRSRRGAQPQVQRRQRELRGQPGPRARCRCRGRRELGPGHRRSREEVEADLTRQQPA